MSSNHVRRVEAETAAASALLLAIHADIEGDDVAKADAIEGQTNLREVMASAIGRLDELDALVDGIRDQKESLDKRRARFERQSDKIKSSLLAAMRGLGERKVELAAATLSIGRSPPSVIVTDANALPDEMLRFKDPEPDKVKIKKNLQDGIAVPGAMLSNQAETLKISRG